MSTAIHWFRRDLRLSDNTALLAATRAHDQVVPVYIVSTWHSQHQWCGAPRQEFLCGCLASLAKNLARRGGRLIIRQGSADEALIQLARETGASAIYCNRDPDPFGQAMEKRIELAATRMGVRFHSLKDVALHERDEITTGAGGPFKVYTPYARAWLRLDKPMPERASSRFVTPPALASDPLPTLHTWKLSSEVPVLDPGEAAARKRLGNFFDGPLFEYATRRDQPALEGTSRLSQDLRHGTLSIREVYAGCVAAAKEAPPGWGRQADVFIRELIWREFYMQVLWHWPEVLDHEWQPDRRRLPWREHWRPGAKPDSESLTRWHRGETGFPLVDAGMRQLAATGFMHNRVRMIVAMFLTKDLHIWWMHGESWFMRRLVDGEVSSNNGGWQWSASTGTDAAPWFRIQNPWSQTRRYDPDGAYIRRWVPELRATPAASLCQPPAPGLRLAPDYPPPMVDHAREREAALDLFRQ